MARIYQNERGLWGVDYRDVSGRQIRRLTNAQSPNEARELLQA